MRLKRYQDRVVAEVGAYLDALSKEWSGGNLKHAGKDAWEAAKVTHAFRTERRNGLARDLPTFCIKVPTGGGKTLLATQILGDIALETDAGVKAWLVANMGFEWFSAKQQRHIVEAVCVRLTKYAGQFGMLKFALLDRIGSASGEKPGLVQRETDRQTEAEFYRLHRAKKLAFFLECIEGRFEIPAEVRLCGTRKLRHDNDEDVSRSLFDYVADDALNQYEKSVALFLDRQPQVLWWYRNIVGSGNFAIQGYKRNRIYPDFVVQRQKQQEEMPFATVLVVESKGKHLRETLDSRYKRDIAKVFEDVGREVCWQDLGEGFDHDRFRFQVVDEADWADRDWRTPVREALAPYG